MPASKLQIQWSGQVILGGPANKEDEARLHLEETLYDILSKCYYLDDSMRASYYAELITTKIPYQIKNTEDKNFVMKVHLDLQYRNPPGPWKWWGRIRSNKNGSEVKNTVKIGDRV